MEAATYLAEQQQDSDSQHVCDQLAQIDRLACLRNRTQIAHGFAGLSRQRLANSFINGQNDNMPDVPIEEADRIVEVMKAIYTSLAGQPPGDNPFDTINTLISELLTGSDNGDR